MTRQARRSALLGLVVGVPTSLFFLWLAFRKADPQAVWAVTKSADPRPLAAAVLLLGAMYVLQGVRWRVIARVTQPSVLGFGEMVVAAVACNNVLPGRLGELFRARWLSVAAPMSSGRAFATVGLDRGCDALTLFAFLLLTLPFISSVEWLRGLAIGAAVAIVLLVAAFLAARAFPRTHIRERRERGRLRRIARDLVDALAEPLGRLRVAVALGLSVVVWGLFAVVVWLVARSVGIHLSPLECVFTTSVVNLGVAIPSSPGFVGTYQWLGVASLGLFDVSHDDALAVTILLHACWYVPTMLVGGLLLLKVDWGYKRGREAGAARRRSSRAPEYHRADA